MRLLMILAIVVLFQDNSIAQRSQLGDGYYIFGSFLGNQNRAKNVFGCGARNQDDVKKVAKAGEVLITIDDNIETGLRLVKDQNPPIISNFQGRGFKLTTTYENKASAKIDFKQYGVDISLNAGKIKSVTFIVSNVKRFVDNSGNIQTDNKRICAQSSGTYNGNFLLGIADGRNYLDAILQGDVSIVANFAKNANVDVNLAETLKAGGGIVDSKAVTFKVDSAWCVGHVIKISDDYCKRLFGRPVQ